MRPNFRRRGLDDGVESRPVRYNGAVFAAYGWPPNLTTQEILARLLALNHERAAANPAGTPKPTRTRHNPTPPVLPPNP